MKEKRSKEIKIRITDSEYENLMKLKSKPRLAEWMREVCLNEKEENKKGSVIERTIPPEIAIQFSKIGSNINQLARAMNIIVNRGDNEDIKQVCTEIRNSLLFIEQDMDDIRTYILTE